MKNPLNKIFGSGIKEASEGIGSLALNIREAIKGKETDPNKQLELIAKAAEVQMQVNKAEAQHRSVFVAGWRPFIGWVCGSALAYNFIARDILIFIFPELADLPPLQMEQLMTILLGMLGLGGLRTYEKLNKVTE